MLLQSGERIVLIGDSVTDFSRGRPVGEGLWDGTGTGYPRVFENMLSAFYPERIIRVTNMGIGGNTIRSLEARWDTDVEALAPDYLTIMIGINDVWRQFDSPAITESHVLPEEYEATYRRLLERTLPKVKGILLATPYYMEPNKSDPMRARMDEYGTIVKKLADEYHTMIYDTQAMFDAYFTHRHSCYIAWDRVHPSQVGATLIACGMLKAFGFDRNPFAD